MRTWISYPELLWESLREHFTLLFEKTYIWYAPNITYCTGVSDISPTLQESQKKKKTEYWFQLFIIKNCTLMDDSTFASRKSSLRDFVWYIQVQIKNKTNYIMKQSWHPKLSLTSETSHWTLSSLDSVPLQSSSRLQSLISKWISKCTFIWKEDSDHSLSNSPVLFLLSPGKMLLVLFLFQKWLGSPFPEDVWAWWLLMH